MIKYRFLIVGEPLGSQLKVTAATAAHSLIGGTKMYRKLRLFFMVSILVLMISGTYAQDNFNIQPVLQYSENWHKPVWDVAIAGGYAFAACKEEGLRVISGYDTDHPTVVGRLTSVCACKVVANGQYVYVTDSYTDLRVVDVSDPANPVQVASVAVNDNINSLRIFGNYLLIAADHNGVAIVDITNPSSAQIVSRCVTDHMTFDTDIQGNRLYVAGISIYVLDVTDMTSPVPLDTLSYDLGDGGVVGIRVSGDYAYLACGESGFHILNLATRELLGYLNSLTYAYSLEYREPYVYLHYGPLDCPLAAIDVTNPDSPQLLSIYSPPTDIRNFVIDGNNAYIADDWYGIRTADLSDPANLHESRRLNPLGNFYDVTTSGDLVYAHSETRVQIFDFADRQHPVERSYLELPFYTRSFLVNGTAGYAVGNWDDGLDVFDLADPSNPVHIANLHCDGYRGAFYDHYLYIVENDDLRIVDISNPHSPQLAGLFTRGIDRIGNALVAVSGHYLFTEADYCAKMLMLDLTNPISPVAVDSCSQHGSCVAMTAQGTYLYCLYHDSLKIFDASQIHPFTEPVCQFPVPGIYGWSWKGVTVSGNMLYLTSDAQGLLVYDISNMDAPVLTGRYRTPGLNSAVAVLGNVAIVADSSNLGFYDCSAAALAGGRTVNVSLPHDVALRANYPNPFNPSTQIPFELPSQCRVTLKVYDVLGRTVATLADGNFAAGSHTLRFDGTGLSSGQYFIRLQTPNKVQTRTITLLK